jgi:hypothetical protein
MNLSSPALVEARRATKPNDPSIAADDTSRAANPPLHGKPDLVEGRILLEQFPIIAISLLGRVWNLS